MWSPMTTDYPTNSNVGPVLQNNDTARAVIAAIQELNSSVILIDRGSYIRVTVPLRCIVTRQSIEKHLNAPFVMQADLERIMPSFKGFFKLSEDAASWELTQS